MKAVLGMISLLAALAIVGLLAARKLKTAAPTIAPGASAAAAAGLATSGLASGGTVREQSQQIQQKVRDDVARALEQGASARKDTSEP